MGKAAIAFKDIGKAASDLLSKDFKVGKNSVEVKSKTLNGVTFTPSATKSGDKLTGSLEAKYRFPGNIEAEATLNTSGVLSTKFEAIDAIAKGMTATVECETPAPGKTGVLNSGKCTFNYKQEMYACKASYDYYKSDLSASATAGITGMTLGCSLDYNTDKSAFMKYAGAFQYEQPDFTFTAKLAESIGKNTVYTGSYFHKVSNSMQVGGELAKASDKESVDIAFGCVYKLDKDTSVKSKVDSDGILSASYKQKISPISTLTLAMAVDTVSLSENKHKFGMQLNVTP
jgi:voltage-dependent anion channel protein 2